MPRSRLTFAVLLAVACADGPTAPDVARAPPTTGLTAEALAAINKVLNDPFVQDVIAQADQTRTVQHTMQEVMDRVAAGEPQALRRAVTAAQQTLHQTNNDEAVVPRAALGLTLEAVQTILDSAVLAQPSEVDAADRRGGHDD